MLRCITCRAEGNLIGYVLFIVQPHLHYMTCKTAFEDLYFVKKEFRRGRIGIKLFQYADDLYLYHNTTMRKKLVFYIVLRNIKKTNWYK